MAAAAGSAVGTFVSPTQHELWSLLPDVLVMCVLKEEQDATVVFLSACAGAEVETGWPKCYPFTLPGVQHTVRCQLACAGVGNLSVWVSAVGSKGSAAMAAAASQLLCIVMPRVQLVMATGTCGGLGMAHAGSVVVATSAVEVCGQGAVGSKDGKLCSSLDWQAWPMGQELKHALRETLTVELCETIACEINRCVSGARFSHEQVHTGCMLAMPVVMAGPAADADMVALKLSPQRLLPDYTDKACGVDMETAALYHACACWGVRVLAAKGVTDTAASEEDDSAHALALAASAAAAAVLLSQAGQGLGLRCCNEDVPYEQLFPQIRTLSATRGDQDLHGVTSVRFSCEATESARAPLVHLICPTTTEMEALTHVLEEHHNAKLVNGCPAACGVPLGGEESRATWKHGTLTCAGGKCVELWASSPGQPGASGLACHTAAMLGAAGRRAAAVLLCSTATGVKDYVSVLDVLVAYTVVDLFNESKLVSSGESGRLELNAPVLLPCSEAWQRALEDGPSTSTRTGALLTRLSAELTRVGCGQVRSGQVVTLPFMLQYDDTPHPALQRLRLVPESWQHITKAGVDTCAAAVYHAAKRFGVPAVSVQGVHSLCSDGAAAAAAAKPHNADAARAAAVVAVAALAYGGETLGLTTRADAAISTDCTRVLPGTDDASARALDADNPETICARSNLAVTLHAMGEYAEALNVEQSVLAARERVLGADHPDTITARANFAATLHAMGDLAAARRMQRAVLAARERVLGADHPDTTSARNNLAVTLHAMGNHTAALGMLESVLAARQRELGADHPDTITPRANLAATLYAMGEYAAARSMQESVLAARERVLGAKHPDTITARANLAATLCAMEEFTDACSVQRSVLAARGRALGTEHPDTITARNNLAATLYAMGNHAAALCMLESALTASERVLGCDHPNTITARANLAATLYAMDEYEAAHNVEREVLAARERVLGVDHPDTITARNNLAVTLYAMGDFAKARRVERSVLADRERVLGSDHPDTIQARNHLAVTLHAMGNHAAARSMLEFMPTGRL